MDIEKLITAAKEIDRLAEKSAERSNAWQELARDSKRGVDRDEIERRRKALDAGVVVDFSTAIGELRAALHAR